MTRATGGSKERPSQRKATSLLSAYFALWAADAFTELSITEQFSGYNLEEHDVMIFQILFLKQDAVA